MFFDLETLRPYNPAVRFHGPLEAVTKVPLRFIHVVILLSACCSLAACSRPSQAHNTSPPPLLEASADSDGDGIPDKAELRSFDDRQNFTRWFAAIAEMQFYQINDEWNAGQRDC